MAHYDLLIKGGLVVSGDGQPPGVADVGVRDGRIAEIGSLAGSAHEQIDAKGLMVTPGFIDIHTHYDGQVIWDERTTASSAHGVTTAIMGNCGVGFAPCREQDREQLLRVMEGVEDIPELVMSNGLTWDWETFPDYLDAIDRRKHEIDVGAQLPHSALRVYAMGRRGAEREAASEADLRRMTDLTREAARAGAVGFATSRNPIHVTRDGEKIPSFSAREQELQAIAQGLKQAGAGVLQVLPDFGDFDAEFEMMKRLVRESGRPLSYSLVQMHSEAALWEHALQLTAEANAEGLPITAQVIGRPAGILLGLDFSYNPFSFCPSYQAIAHLPLRERVTAMRQPDVKARILADVPGPPPYPALATLRTFERMFPFGNPPNYEPAPDSAVAPLARAHGKRPDELAYELLLEEEGSAVLFAPAANFATGNLDAACQMLKHPNTVPALGDGGAHYGLVSDSSYPTHMLTYWARDRRGERLGVAQVVRLLAYEPARRLRLLDRGVLAAGKKADINVIDFDHLRLHAPKVYFDLPAGGRRVMQGADGFRATVVGGKVIRRDGISTGELPGKLIRSVPAPQQLS